MNELFRLEIIVSEVEFPLAEAIVAQHIHHGWEERNLEQEQTLLRVHCVEEETCADLIANLQAYLPQIAIEKSRTPQENWTEAWREFFTPVNAGCFVVLPPWLAQEARADQIPLIIEPKSAFGTGHHPSTALCLQAISQLYGQKAIAPEQLFFDVGTGSGILGIACAKLGLQGTGVDIDGESIPNAVENCQLNEAEGRFQALVGSTELAQGKQFDLVIANILAKPLIEMAPTIMQLVRPGGALVLSGILAVQADGVAAAYAALGEHERLEAPSLNLPADSHMGESNEHWACLIWKDVSAIRNL